MTWKRARESLLQSHWQDVSSCLLWLEVILKPHLEKRRLLLDKPDAYALLVWDLHFSYRGDDVKNWLEKNNIKQVFIPPSLTDLLQPCDLTVNRSFKASYRSAYTSWLANSFDSDDDIDWGMKSMKKEHIKWCQVALNTIIENGCGCKGWRLSMEADL